MPPKGNDVEAKDLQKLEQEKKKSDFEALGLDTSGLDWSSLIEPGTCGACHQKFGEQDKDAQTQ